jgi:hypothetical protein
LGFVELYQFQTAKTGCCLGNVITDNVVIIWLLLSVWLCIKVMITLTGFCVRHFLAFAYHTQIILFEI